MIQTKVEIEICDRKYCNTVVSSEEDFYLPPSRSQCFDKKLEGGIRVQSFTAKTGTQYFGSYVFCSNKCFEEWKKEREEKIGPITVDVIYPEEES